MTARPDTYRPNTPATMCFSVQAQAGPGVLPRVLDLFAKKGLTPDRVAANRAGDFADELHIDLQVAGLPDTEADVLAAKMRQLVDVALVLTYRKDAADGRIHHA